ncbi:zinc finger protein 490 isoform X3 [Rhipicephalus sanguineus]|uniref:zinc finger protein 490 isoform X3 n=1 Tax=Rhipicephalus sanguineus TaxID=34632 RepID=UPI001893D010|nr:zinc finger protein 490 isoform X3 [Rhipicephalus sanguineus]
MSPRVAKSEKSNQKESQNSAQRRRRAEKLNSKDPEIVAWQLAVQRRNNEKKKAKRAAETPEQREERRAKRRRQEAERRAGRARPYVQQKRCPCGQVLNMKDSSQLPGWEVRRDVSIQCGLQQMPLLPLPVKIVPSRSTGDNVEEGTHQGMSKASKDERLFQCHCCKYSAPEVYKLRRHLLTHSTVNPFECEVCPAAFRTLASYKAHICKHTGETLHECDLCPYSAAYKSRVLEHRRTHLNAYTMYAYRAKSKSRLRMQKHQHTSNKPFKCKVCSLGFTRKYSLKIHMQRHLESRLS